VQLITDHQQPDTALQPGDEVRLLLPHLTLAAQVTDRTPHLAPSLFPTVSSAPRE
jgi:hypothetical protein